MKRLSILLALALIGQSVKGLNEVEIFELVNSCKQICAKEGKPTYLDLKQYVAALTQLENGLKEENMPVSRLQFILNQLETLIEEVKTVNADFKELAKLNDSDAVLLEVTKIKANLFALILNEKAEASALMYDLSLQGQAMKKLRSAGDSVADSATNAGLSIFNGLVYAKDAVVNNPKKSAAVVVTAAAVGAGFYNKEAVKAGFSKAVDFLKAQNKETVKKAMDTAYLDFRVFTDITAPKAFSSASAKAGEVLAQTSVKAAEVLAKAQANPRTTAAAVAAPVATVGSAFAAVKAYNTFKAYRAAQAAKKAYSAEKAEASEESVTDSNASTSSKRSVEL